MSILSANSGDVPTNPTGPIDPSLSVGDWHHSLRTAIRSLAELRELLRLPPIADGKACSALVTAAEDFPIFAPREYVSRMEPANPFDPLLLQIMPSAAETAIVPGFGVDPVGDLSAARPIIEDATSRPVSGLTGVLHKYHGRALLITTGACAVHCRYCFRRHFPYAETPRGLADWEPAIASIASDKSIEEVILSGGDPLTLRDDWLAQLAERLSEIPHLQRLRVHTRLPIMIPSRVTDELLGWLRGTRLSPVMVIHSNHANELIGADVEAALANLVDAGIPVLNQAVLLKGVNDNVKALEELSRQLVALRVMPYYLHQLDKVAGAAHFEVPMEVGRRLVQELRTRLSGYMIPRYVMEQPGEPSKTVLE